VLARSPAGRRRTIYVVEKIFLPLALNRSHSRESVQVIRGRLPRATRSARFSTRLPAPSRHPNGPHRRSGGLRRARRSHRRDAIASAAERPPRSAMPLVANGAGAFVSCRNDGDAGGKCATVFHHGLSPQRNGWLRERPGERCRLTVRGRACCSRDRSPPAGWPCRRWPS
jgi:hypothetical protein